MMKHFLSRLQKSLETRYPKSYLICQPRASVLTIFVERNLIGSLLSLKSRVTASATVAALALTFTIAAPVASPASAAPSIGSTISLPAGSVPVSVAISPDGTKAYVANRGSAGTPNGLSVISLANDTLGTPIPIPDSLLKSVAFQPNGNKAYVTEESTGDMTVISGDAVDSTVDLGDYPGFESVTFSPDGTKAYATSGVGSVLAVISVATNTVTKTVHFTDAGLDVGLVDAAFSPDGTKAYLATAIGDTLTVMNTSNDTVAATITLPVICSRSVTVTPDGTKAYVTSDMFDTVSVIDLATNSVSTLTFSSRVQPVDVAVTPDGKKAIVIGNSDVVLVVDVATDTVTSTLSLPEYSEPTSVVITSDSSKAYVSNAGSSTVSVITLKGITSAPRQLAYGARTGTSVVLRWKVPQDKDGGVITDYLVQYRETGATEWSTFTHTPSTTRRQVVTGLTTNTRYEFQVAATTAVGTSEFSPTVTRSTRRH
jgi:YVTN family beta-propeller protein